MKVKDICPLVIDEMELTKEDLEQMIPSRKKYTYKDRIDWAIQYLKNAGLIERISHGTYRLTEEGHLNPAKQLIWPILNNLILLSIFMVEARRW